MADLELTLSWLDMSQYFERFVRAGFDSWETIMEITEQDLESLNVELGHRRKLQREIANSRRLSQDPAFVTPLYNVPSEGKKSESLSGSASVDGDIPSAVSTKRRYRHHPKSDKNVPERPYSAYVLFSNKMREELKDQMLSFTEISRKVGERWQLMPPEEKELWKQRAAVPWEKYKSDLAEYQKTDSYKEYNEYLTEFRASQTPKKSTDAQRQLSPSQPSGVFQGFSHKKSGSSSRESSIHKSMQALSTVNSMAPPSSPIKDVKREESTLLVDRVRKEIDPNGSGPTHLRVAQACEPCRQRKTKCYGEKPACRHCQELRVECYYGEVKRDKDRKLLLDLWRKANAYEELLLRFMHQLDNVDQSTVQQCLLMTPRLDDFNSSVLPTPRSTSVSNRSSEFGGAESRASGVGSMGSTDHTNEEDFTQAESERKSKAFVGQASEIRWMQRLERELAKVPASDSARQDLPRPGMSASSKGKERLSQSTDNHNPNPYPDDMDTSIIGDQLDPFEMPVRSTADRLVDSYFKTVHPSFPIIDKAYFKVQYGQYFASQDSENFGDINFIATLQLVLAIGAVHAHLVGAEWAGDERDHLLYFAKARMLGIDTGILNDMAYLGQVQLFGLGGMYLMVTDQINRAWNTVGVAIRCAQSLGMHLINTTPTLTQQQKDHRAMVWFSVLALERNITVITGRPPMVRDRDCSITMPQPVVSDGPSQKADYPPSTTSVSSLDFGIRASASPSSLPVQGTFGSGQSQLPLTNNTDAYFSHYVQLTALAQDATAQIYCPEIRHVKWSEIQRRIDELDGKLVQWNATLPKPFNFEDPYTNPESESYRVTLAIISHSTRTIINRPCLCRLDRRIPDQSLHSNHRGHVAANKCVSSARVVLQLISDKPHDSVLYQGTLWWMIVHHLRRAATVVLLELAFRAEHMPAEAENILADAKRAVNWLRAVAVSDNAARRSWTTLSRLLHLAAQRVGGDASEVVTAPFSQTGETRPGGMAGQQQPFTPSDQFDPNVWQPMDNYYASHFPGEQGSSEFDQYGFFPPGGGTPSMFPPSGELGGMRDQQGPVDEDQAMWSGWPDPSLGDWYGQFGGS